MTNIPVLMPSDFLEKDGFGKFAREHREIFTRALGFALKSVHSTPEDATANCHLETGEGYFGAVVSLRGGKEYTSFSFKEKSR